MTAGEHAHVTVVVVDQAGFVADSTPHLAGLDSLSRRVLPGHLRHPARDRLGSGEGVLGWTGQPRDAVAAVVHLAA